MEKILGYSDLENIITLENNDPLVVVQDHAPSVICSAINSDMAEYCGDRMLLRKEASLRLNQVALELSKEYPDARIKSVYAYRHPKLQEKYFEDVIAEIKVEHPDLSLSELRKRAHLLIAVPEVAGHPTGAAVDVTITENSQEWDMGTAIWDLKSTDLIPTFSPNISDMAKRNRMILRGLMLNQGFAPFNGEWWHFSYGDKEWAAYYGKPAAMYSGIEI